MPIAFYLSMPNCASWNGRWSGEGRNYVIVRNLGRSKAAQLRTAELDGKSWYYNFGDGWGANVSARVVEPKEGARLRRTSAGFAGYDWMVESILRHDRILKYEERRDAARDAVEKG